MVALILFIVLLGLKVGFGRLADFEFDAGSVPFATTIAPPMPCITNESELAYNRAGYVSAQYSFLNCLANVDSPDLIPTFYNGMINGVLNVNISLGLNNLASLDAVAGTVTLDFYLRLYWFDQRLAMPLMWDKMDSTIKSKGIDVSNMLTNDSVYLWLPDIQFNDASEVNTIVQKIRINSANYMTWSRHMTATFMQSKFEFYTYPNDIQKIQIRAGSYSYALKYLKLGYFTTDSTSLNNPSLFYTQDDDGTVTFKNNPLWSWISGTSSIYSSTTQYSFSLWNITVQRKGKGIIVRLILPITLLLVLAGLTFWAQFENRVDSTVTLLLAVSALYIVILGNIPMLGYLTDVDKYVFVMFLLLVIVVTAHQTYATLTEKQEQWPLRKLYLRLIEFGGRTFIFPIVLSFYLYQINDPDTQTKEVMTILGFIMCSIIMIRESSGVYKSYQVAMINLLKKVNEKTCSVKDVSKVEALALNMYLFRTLSFSMLSVGEMLHKEGVIEDVARKSLDLRNLYTMKETLGFAHSDTENTTTPHTKGSPTNSVKKRRGTFIGRKSSLLNNSSENTQEAQASGEIMMTTFQNSLAQNPLIRNSIGASEMTNEPRFVNAGNRNGRAKSVSFDDGNLQPSHNLNGINDNGDLMHLPDESTNRDSLSSGMRRSIDNVYDSDDEEV